jgi:hypothetical protein
MRRLHHQNDGADPFHQVGWSIQHRWLEHTCQACGLTKRDWLGEHCNHHSELREVDVFDLRMDACRLQRFADRSVFAGMRSVFAILVTASNFIRGRVRTAPRRTRSIDRPNAGCLKTGLTRSIFAFDPERPKHSLPEAECRQAEHRDHAL